MWLRLMMKLLERLESGIIDPEYEPDLDDYEYRQLSAEKGNQE